MTTLLSPRLPVGSTEIVRLLSAFIMGAVMAPAYAQTSLDNASTNWFTGSLLSPSGTVAHRNDLAVETYLVLNESEAYFDNNGSAKDYSEAHKSFTSVTSIEYGVSDRLSIIGFPEFDTPTGRSYFIAGPRMGDLPIDVRYRAVEGNGLSLLSPSLTVYTGVSFPLGQFDRLSPVRAGIGTGAYLARFGFQLQSSAIQANGRSLRLRGWFVARKPLGVIDTTSISIYGTTADSLGKVSLKPFGNTGLAFEYSLSQRFALSGDIVYNRSGGYSVLESRMGDALATYQVPGAKSLQLAPAIEYSWSPNFGIILGAPLTLAGRRSDISRSIILGLNCYFPR